MFEHDLEKIGSAVSKHSANLKGSGFSTKNLAENPKQIDGVLTPGTPGFWMYVSLLLSSSHHQQPLWEGQQA